eukprot:Rhum_TRINITY_DN14247_c31_g1::Rhum_TRINITY_DN14247_c31_g1_i1::g.77350::m.77350
MQLRLAVRSRLLLRCFLLLCLAAAAANATAPAAGNELAAYCQPLEGAAGQLSPPPCVYSFTEDVESGWVPHVFTVYLTRDVGQLSSGQVIALVSATCSCASSECTSCAVRFSALLGPAALPTTTTSGDPAPDMELYYAVQGDLRMQFAPDFNGPYSASATVTVQDPADPTLVLYSTEISSAASGNVAAVNDPVTGVQAIAAKDFSITAQEIAQGKAHNTVLRDFLTGLRPGPQSAVDEAGTVVKAAQNFCNVVDVDQATAQLFRLFPPPTLVVEAPGNDGTQAANLILSIQQVSAGPARDYVGALALGRIVCNLTDNGPKAGSVALPPGLAVRILNFVLVKPDADAVRRGLARTAIASDAGGRVSFSVEGEAGSGFGAVGADGLVADADVAPVDVALLEADRSKGVVPGSTVRLADADPQAAPLATVRVAGAELHAAATRPGVLALRLRANGTRLDLELRGDLGRGGGYFEVEFAAALFRGVGEGFCRGGVCTFAATLPTGQDPWEPEGLRYARSAATLVVAAASPALAPAPPPLLPILALLSRTAICTADPVEALDLFLTPVPVFSSSAGGAQWKGSVGDAHRSVGASVVVSTCVVLALAGAVWGCARACGKRVEAGCSVAEAAREPSWADRGFGAVSLTLYYFVPQAAYGVTLAVMYEPVWLNAVGGCVLVLFLVPYFAYVTNNVMKNAPLNVVQYEVVARKGRGSSGGELDKSGLLSGRRPDNVSGGASPSSSSSADACNEPVFRSTVGAMWFPRVSVAEDGTVPGAGLVPVRWWWARRQLLDPVLESRRFFRSFELLCLAGLGAVAALKAESLRACFLRSAGFTGLLGFYTLATVAARPYVSSLHLVTQCGVLFVEVAASSLLAAELHEEDESRLDEAWGLPLVLFAIAFVLALVSLLAVQYFYFALRRHRARFTLRHYKEDAELAVPPPSSGGSGEGSPRAGGGHRRRSSGSQRGGGDSASEDSGYSTGGSEARKRRLRDPSHQHHHHSSATAVEEAPAAGAGGGGSNPLRTTLPATLVGAPERGALDAMSPRRIPAGGGGGSRRGADGTGSVSSDGEGVESLVIGSVAIPAAASVRQRQGSVGRRLSSVQGLMTQTQSSRSASMSLTPRLVPTRSLTPNYPPGSSGRRPPSARGSERRLLSGSQRRLSRTSSRTAVGGGGASPPPPPPPAQAAGTVSPPPGSHKHSGDSSFITFDTDLVDEHVTSEGEDDFADRSSSRIIRMTSDIVGHDGHGAAAVAKSTRKGVNLINLAAVPRGVSPAEATPGALCPLSYSAPLAERPSDADDSHLLSAPGSVNPNATGRVRKTSVLHMTSGGGTGTTPRDSFRQGGTPRDSFRDTSKIRRKTLQETNNGG